MPRGTFPTGAVVPIFVLTGPQIFWPFGTYFPSSHQRGGWTGASAGGGGLLLIHCDVLKSCLVLDGTTCCPIPTSS